MRKINNYTQCLIGKQIEIVKSPNPTLDGSKGQVIDETKYIIVIRNEDNQITKLQKNQVEFKIIETDFIIDGKKIMKSPEERIKLRIKND